MLASWEERDWWLEVVPEPLEEPDDVEDEPLCEAE